MVWPCSALPLCCTILSKSHIFWQGSSYGNMGNKVLHFGIQTLIRKLEIFLPKTLKKAFQSFDIEFWISLNEREIFDTVIVFFGKSLDNFVSHNSKPQNRFSEKRKLQKRYHALKLGSSEHYQNINETTFLKKIWFHLKKRFML
jgi:hypothetical protein